MEGDCPAPDAFHNRHGFILPNALGLSVHVPARYTSLTAQPHHSIPCVHAGNPDSYSVHLPG